jgi:galactonate dehydratase
LKISKVEIRAIGEPGGAEYAVLKLVTDEGLSGYGEAPATPSPQIAVDRMNQELAQLIGLDPAQVLRIDRDLREAGASPASRASVNTALLDLLAKSAKAPLYEYLGGPTRNKARAMAFVHGDSAADIRKAVISAKARGHRAFSIPLAMPDGMERGRSFYTNIRATLDDLRQAAGEECDFVLDCGARLTPGEALSIGDRMEDFHLLWLDEPCGDLNAASQASISRGTSTPVGFGRGFTGNSRFQDLLREDGIDVLRPSIALNGITAIRKAAAIAETYYIAVAPYHRGGPIGAATGIHIAASLPNSFIQETPFFTHEATRKARREIAGGWDETPVEGFFPLLEGPGLGIAINDQALANYTIAQ